MIFRTTLLTILFIISTCDVILAYVGPGAGLSLLGALWGLLVAVLAALLFVVFWPIRRLWRRSRERKNTEREKKQTP